MQHEAHVRANFAGAACSYIPKDEVFNFFVITSSSILINMTTDTKRAPNARLPTCKKDLLIDLMIGCEGFPS